MKTKLLTFLLSGLVGLSLNAFADDDHGGDNQGDQQGDNQGGQEGENQGDDQQGGNIDGTETLLATITLAAPTNAPSSATGTATLVSDNEDGTVTATLTIDTQGLIAGDYTLSVVKKSDASSVTVGTITIGGSGDDGGDGEADCHNEGTNSPPSGVLLSHSEVEIPAGLDPTDIAQIILSDTNGTAVLVGDLVTPSPTSAIKLKALIHVKDSNGNVAGTAAMQSITKKGKRRDTFTLIASNVPASTTLNVHLNGTKVGTVKSNKKGKAMVKKLPPKTNLLTVRSVKLMDGQGQAAASANF
jgi:hypothetical protein